MYIELSEIMRLKGRLSDVKASLKSTLDGVSNEIIDVNNNIQSSELISSNHEISTKIANLKVTLDNNIETIITFLSTQIDSYQNISADAKESLESLIYLINSTFDNNGKLVTQQPTMSATNVYDEPLTIRGTTEGSTSPTPQPQLSESVPSGVVSQPDLSAATLTTATTAGVTQTVAEMDGAAYSDAPVVDASSAGSASDISVYTNKPECGFVVTTDNQSYSLSDSDRDLIYSIVAAESDKSYDDSLAVASVILNRCESPAWVSSFGSNPVAQATARNQFVVYQQGHYRKYMGGNAPDTVKRAVDDALNGVRNCDYLSFRSSGTTSYSNNQVTSSGNRYK